MGDERKSDRGNQRNDILSEWSLHARSDRDIPLSLYGKVTEQLKALLEEKQHLQTRIDAAKKEAANRINEDSRMAELAAYLEEHLSGFQQYDDGIVRKMIERVTVVDEETIRVKFRYSDLEIEQTVR